MVDSTAFDHNEKSVGVIQKFNGFGSHVSERDFGIDVRGAAPVNGIAGNKTAFIALFERGKRFADLP